MTKATVKQLTDRTLKIERLFNASRARVWDAYSKPELLAQWWGRGNKVTVEKFEFKKGGHWRFVEHSGGQTHGFEGRFAEIEAPAKIVQTFEWDGMPGHVSMDTMVLEEVGPQQTKLTVTSLFMTAEDCAGMMASGMEGGMNESYAALDRLLAK